MATNTAGSTAREYHSQQVHYLRRDITFAETTAVALTVGVIPAGSVIIKAMSGTNISTVFNHGTNNRLDIGPTTNDDLYGVDVSLLTANFLPLTETVSHYVSVDTTIIATPDLTGTAGTTGIGQIVIAYVPDNDL